MKLNIPKRNKMRYACIYYNIGPSETKNCFSVSFMALSSAPSQMSGHIVVTQKRAEFPRWAGRVRGSRSRDHGETADHRQSRRTWSFLTALYPRAAFPLMNDDLFLLRIRWVQLSPNLWVWLFKWMKMRFQRTSKQSKYHIGWVSLSRLEWTVKEPDYETWLCRWDSGCGQGPFHRAVKKSHNWKYTVESIYVHLHTEVVPKLNISTFAFSFSKKEKKERERERKEGKVWSSSLDLGPTRCWMQHF